MTEEYLRASSFSLNYLSMENFLNSLNIQRIPTHTPSINSFTSFVLSVFKCCFISSYSNFS